MLGRWRAEKPKSDNVLGWTLARGGAGELILTLPSRAGSFKAPIITSSSGGGLTVREAASSRRAYQLAPGAAISMVASSPSVILGTSTRGEPAFSIAPVIKKGSKPEIRYAKGKIHNVSVERVSDDGMQTGVWRGFVKSDGRGGDLFLELLPAFRLEAGTDLRVVGVIDETVGSAKSGVRGRFKRGAWVPVDERLHLFASDLMADISPSDGDSEDSGAVMAQCLDACATVRQGRRLEEVRLPFTCRPLGSEETPAQKGLRRRLLADKAQPQKVFTRGRKMAIPATDWHGAIQKNGDLIIEVRRPPFDIAPSRVTVIVNREVVSTRDHLPSRIGVRCQFPDGSAVSMLLGGGPQNLAAEIAKRKNIVVVQGEPDAKTYADISAFVADVVKR
jgi:hypothetical protein